MPGAERAALLARERQVHAVEALAGGDVERLAAGAGEAAVARVLRRRQEAELLPLGAEEVDPGRALTPGGRDDGAVRRDCHPVDAAFLAEVEQLLSLANGAVLLQRVGPQLPRLRLVAVALRDVERLAVGRNDQPVRLRGVGGDARHLP